MQANGPSLIGVVLQLHALDFDVGVQGKSKRQVHGQVRGERNGRDVQEPAVIVLAAEPQDRATDEAAARW